MKARAPTRLPVPSAVGLPLASSEAEALPQAGPRVSTGAALTAGYGAVARIRPARRRRTTPSSSARLSGWCRVRSRPPRPDWSDTDSSGRAERHAPVPRASARSARWHPTSEPPPETWRLLSRLSETKPPSALRFHVAGVVAAPADVVNGADDGEGSHARCCCNPATTPHAALPLPPPACVGTPLHG